MSYGWPPVEIEPVEVFGPTTALIWVLVFGVPPLLMFAFTVWRFFVHRGRSLRAESLEKRPRELVEGPALLHGSVETDDGAPAVRIEIDQTGAEYSNKGQYSYKWTEKNRTVHTRPFRLRLPTDETVTVTPDDRIRLVDRLETEKFEGAYRRRVAELSHKENVWVSGVLSHEGSKGGATTAYRSGPGSFVLRGTRMEPLEVAAGGLERQFAYWRAYYRKAAIMLGIVCAVLHGGLFMPYYALALFGRVEMGTITRTNTYVTTYKNSRRTHYEIYAKLPPSAGGLVVKDEVGFTLYMRADTGDIKQVPFIIVPSMPSLASIGDRPSLSIIAGILGLLTSFLTILLYPLARRAVMPWYEQKKVVERGQGTLASRAWHVQVPGKPGLYEEGTNRKAGR